MILESGSYPWFSTPIFLLSDTFGFRPSIRIKVKFLHLE
jgi:hypothetical protein